MRQIKFRAWDHRMGVMLENIMVGGYEETVPTAPKKLPNGGCDLFHLVGDEPIMQFTGLHDRNGKEIFEGDIVSSPHFKDAAGRHHTLRHVCEWSDRYHSWFLRNIKDQTTDKSDGSIQLFVATRNTDLEVIGNIYETPSLIQGETE